MRVDWLSWRDGLKTAEVQSIFEKGLYLRGRAMSKKRISQNDACPCGSGKEYKDCCNRTRFERVEDEDGAVGKSIPMPDEPIEVFQHVQQAFIDTYGREPDVDELLDGVASVTQHVEILFTHDMTLAGLDDAFIYAFEKISVFVSEEYQH